MPVQHLWTAFCVSVDVVDMVYGQDLILTSTVSASSRVPINKLYYKTTVLMPSHASSPFNWPCYGRQAPSSAVS